MSEELLTVPVFDRAHLIQGYLTLAVTYRRGRSFTLRAQRGLVAAGHNYASFAKALAPARVKDFVFEWNSIGCCRPPDEVSHCDVLIVDNADGLDLLGGFKFFAEVHGTTKVVQVA